MASFGEKVRARRKELNLTQQQLAKLSDLSQTTIGDIERGRNTSSVGLVDLAKALKCKAEDLVTTKDAKMPAYQKFMDRTLSNYRSVPVISWIRAGRMSDIENIDDPDVGSWPIESPDHTLGPRGWALRVAGDSMDDGSPNGIREGWIIFVDPDKPAVAGSYVIAKDVRTQQATFKKLAYDGGTWYLKPLNPHYPMIEIDDPAVRVIGVVTEARPPSRKLS